MIECRSEEVERVPFPRGSESADRRCRRLLKRLVVLLQLITRMNEDRADNILSDEIRFEHPDYPEFVLFLGSDCLRV